MSRAVSGSENESARVRAIVQRQSGMWRVHSDTVSNTVGTSRCEELSDCERARVRVTEGEWELQRLKAESESETTRERYEWMR